jgi:hypothetical protein
MGRIVDPFIPVFVEMKKLIVNTKKAVVFSF